MFKRSTGLIAGQHDIASLAVSAHPVVSDCPTGSNAIPHGPQGMDPARSAGLFAKLERRGGARVNLRRLGLSGSNDLRVSVTCDQRCVDVTPVDLSLKDICVESEQEIAGHGERVDLTLTHGDSSVVLPAIAVRQDHIYMQTAFLFIDDEWNDDTRGNVALERIYRALVSREHRQRYGRTACLALGAACSILVLNWVFL